MKFDIHKKNGKDNNINIFLRIRWTWMTFTTKTSVSNVLWLKVQKKYLDLSRSTRKTNSFLYFFSILSMVVPVYNAELAPKNLRGRLVSLNQLFITAGIMVSLYMHSVYTIRDYCREGVCHRISLSLNLSISLSISICLCLSLSVSLSVSLSLLSFFIFCIVG